MKGTRMIQIKRIYTAVLIFYFKPGIETGVDLFDPCHQWSKKRIAEATLLSREFGFTS
jgi:hypothetical protein